MKRTINVTDNELLWLSLDHLYHGSVYALDVYAKDLTDEEKEAYQNFVDARNAVLDAYQKLGDVVLPGSKGAA